MGTGKLWVGASLGVALLLGSHGLRAQEPIGNSRSSGPGVRGLPQPATNGHGPDHDANKKNAGHKAGEHESKAEEVEEEQEGGLFINADFLIVKPRRRPHDVAILDPAADNVVAGQVQNFDWETVGGYRLGLGWRLKEGWEIGGVYTYLHSSDTVAISRPTNGELFATLSAPITFDSANSAKGSSNVDLDLIDAEIAKRWVPTENLWVRLCAGGRAATIQQKTNVVYDFTAVGFGTSNVNSRIQFDGFGPRVGGEGFWRFCSNFGLFAKAYGSLMVGDFKNNLNQFVNSGRTVIVDVSDKYCKVVPNLEMAVGLGWKSDHVSLKVGYELQNFFGMVDLIDFPDQSSYKNSYRTGDLSLEAVSISLGIAY